MKVKVLVTQLCLTPCDPMDYSLPGSSVHGILQARILEWLPISFSRITARPRDRTRVSCIMGRFFTIREALRSPYNPGKKDIRVTFKKEREKRFLCGLFFKVFIEFFIILTLHYVLLIWSWGTWDLSSPTRERTCTPCRLSQSLDLQETPTFL